LYRLTNSLWKVYNSQNLELSRNFTRLITKITNENRLLSVYQRPQLFNTTQSLHNLVGGLQQAFSGTNLHLRKSLVSLVSDIHKAGDTSTSTHHHRQHDLNLFYLRGRYNSANTSDYVSEYTVSQKIDDKIKTVIPEKIPQPENISRFDFENTDRLVNTIISKVQQAQAEQWQLEKLQRGIL
jgi:hypothetical protein